MHIALIDKAKVNERIDAEEVRLISEDGEQLGIVALEDALTRAEDVGSVSYTHLRAHET